MDNNPTKQVIEENAKNAPVKDILWNANELSAESDTKLEEDKGSGKAAIIRMFEFGINIPAFKEYKPSKQELLNSHAKGIEIMLWKDGMKLMPEVNPKVDINHKRGTYRIFVGAEPQRGHILHERPQTLTQIANPLAKRQKLNAWS